MRAFWALVAVSVLIPTALFVWAIGATKSSDATGASLTLGFVLILSIAIDAGLWLAALLFWIFRVYRRDSEIDESRFANLS